MRNGSLVDNKGGATNLLTGKLPSDGFRLTSETIIKSNGELIGDPLS